MFNSKSRVPAIYVNDVGLKITTKNKKIYSKIKVKIKLVNNVTHYNSIKFFKYIFIVVYNVIYFNEFVI